MFALSVHGPAGLAFAAPVYFAVAASLTALSAFRLKRASVTIASGVLMLALAPGTFLLLDRLERIAEQRRVAATQVSDVRDELILSARGRPLGVRISYSVSVPATGYFGITPSLYSRDPAAGRLQLAAMKWTIDGHPEPRPFQAERSHAIVVELYPTLLFIKPQGERCLSPIAVPALPESPTPKPLRLEISETPYGAPWRGGREESTHGAYDIGEMYRGVLAEGLQPCKIGP